MAYQHTLRNNDYQRADEIHVHRATRSWWPLALLGALVLAALLWALARNRSSYVNDNTTTQRETPMETPGDRTAPRPVNP
jgi:hypothetical protein